MLQKPHKYNPITSELKNNSAKIFSFFIMHLGFYAKIKFSVWDNLFQKLNQINVFFFYYF